MLIIAHRGYSAAQPENSLQAFDAAVAAGADFIETDPRLSLDGIVVCCHDPSLERRARRPEVIAETDFASLRAIPLEGGARIATLDEVLDLAKGRIPVVLDVKVAGPEMQDRIEAVAGRTGMGDDLVQGVRTLDDCRWLRTRHPRRDILAFLSDYGDIGRFAAAGATIIRLWEEDVTVERLAAIQMAGCRTWVTCGLRRQGEIAGACEARRLAGLAQVADGVILNDPIAARAAIADPKVTT